MQITIIKPDGIVGVDGVFRNVDLSSISPDIHAIQFNDQSNLGHIEYATAEDGSKNPNEKLTSFSDYSALITAWEAEAPPPPPPPPEPLPPQYPKFTALEMLNLFSDAEQLAVVNATMTNAAVKLWYDRMIAATFVTYEDPRTEGGLQALVDSGLLTAERKAEIVAAMLPV